VPDRAPAFVYVIYIAASAETVWNGLIDREVTKHYWGHHNRSDWKPGSRWEHVREDGSGKVDIAGRVLEIDPPRRLVTSWASPENEQDPEKVSRVVYELEAAGADTKLTVTHSELEAGSAMLAGISRGWPAVLSNLKTQLETGRIMTGLWSKE
jgi:uncharacterized protein YndB with AHSA1/START domain